MIETRFNIIDQRLERVEPNIVANRASLARIESALPHFATRKDMADVLLHATKPRRGMVVSIFAAGIAVASVAAIFWPV